MSSNSTQWRIDGLQSLPDQIRGGLQYYYYSCQIIVLFALPVSLSGLIASSFTILVLPSNGCVHHQCLLNYIEVFSGLFVNIGDLLCLRLSLLLPAIVAYHVGTIQEGFSKPFDPMFRAGANYCKALIFTRHFFNAFRCNLILATYIHLGWETVHQLSTLMSLCAVFLIALISSLPVLILTDYQKAWNLTFCDFDLRTHPLLLAWANMHCILYCDNLVSLLIVTFLSQGVDVLQRQLDASSRYLSNATPKSFFMSALFTSLSSKLKGANGRLALLSYYCRFVATTKLLFAIAKLCICLNARNFAAMPLEYVSFCLWKATIDNYACLFDVVLLMFAPVWWYCKSIQLRAKVCLNFCKDNLNSTNIVRRIMPPNEAVTEECGKVEAIEFLSDSTTRQVANYRERLLTGSEEFMPSTPLRFHRQR